MGPSSTLEVPLGEWWCPVTVIASPTKTSSTGFTPHADHKKGQGATMPLPSESADRLRFYYSGRSVFQLQICAENQRSDNAQVQRHAA